MELTQKDRIENIYEGFLESCDIVATSMGAEGGFGILTDRSELEAPKSTKDGVSICKSIYFEDRYKNSGAYFAKQAALKTMLKSGDATTTTLVFARDIVNLSRGNFDSHFKRGVLAAHKDFEQILSQIKTTASKEQLYNVANISANGDKEIADMVMEAFEYTNSISVQEDYNSPECSLVKRKGMFLDKGWKTPFMCDPKTAIFKEKDVKVLVFEGNIMPESAGIVEFKINELIKSHGSVSNLPPIVIFCETMSELVTVKVENMVSMGIKICVVEAPFFAERRKAIVDDIALYVGVDRFVQGVSTTIDWGFADEIIITQDSTSIIQKEVSQKVLDRVEELKSQLKTTSEKDFFETRINQLSGKTAVIKVGDLTDISRKEKFDRFEDAVPAVKSASEQGIVAGGGSALVYISNLMERKFENESEQRGYNTIKKALLAPYKTILSNAAVSYDKYIFRSEELNTGYNVKTLQVENLMETGVVDSVKSIRTALENAISVSLMLLNTKAAV